MLNVPGLLLLALMVLLAGCIGSLQPLYTDKDLVFDPGLIGLWSEENGKETWLFEKEGEKAYRLTYADERGRKGVFLAHLFTLEGSRFLDLFPEDRAMEAWAPNDFFKLHYVPVHTFLKVPQLTPKLQMAALGAEWLSDQLKKNPKAIAHERQGDRVILTAPTEALQAFLREHGRTDEAWGDPVSLTRRPSPPPP
jgi:hypothetical protein